MELPFELNKRVTEYLLSIPNITTIDNQRSLIFEASLDIELQKQINFITPTSDFILQLIPTLNSYGRLRDGRYALQAVLEVTKNRVGQEKKYTVKLLFKR